MLRASLTTRLPPLPAEELQYNIRVTLLVSVLGLARALLCFARVRQRVQSTHGIGVSKDRAVLITQNGFQHHPSDAVIHMRSARLVPYGVRATTNRFSENGFSLPRLFEPEEPEWVSQAHFTFMVSPAPISTTIV